MIKILCIVLAVVSILELIFVRNGNQNGRMVTKPLLVPLLTAIYVLSCNTLNYAMLGALFFCFLGDVFLLFTYRHDAFFKLGLVSFLKGHLLYIFAFMPPIASLSSTCVIFVVPYTIVFICLYSILRDHLDSMRIPVIVYIVVILLMSFTSVIRVYHFSGCQFWMPFIGSLLFIASDFSLAYNLFVKKGKDNSILVMLTYILAQVSIVMGFIN